jgi:hypothetical protein
VTETQFYLPSTFSTQESTIEAAIQAGRQKIDVGFERGSVVVNGSAQPGKTGVMRSQSAIREGICVEPIGCQLGLWRFLGWSPITLMANF